MAKAASDFLGRNFVAQAKHAPESARPVSLAVVAGVMRALDGFLALGAGIAALFWTAAETGPRVTLVFFGALLAVNLLYFAGAYRRDVMTHLNASLWRGLAATLMAAAGVIVALRLGGSRTAGQPWLQIWFIASLSLLVSTRVVLVMQLRYWRRAGQLCRTVAVIGAGPIGQRLLRHFNTQPEEELQVVGVYDDRLPAIDARCIGHPFRGGIDALLADLRIERVDTAIVALPLAEEQSMIDTLNKLRHAPLDVALCVDQLGTPLAGARTMQIAGVGFIQALSRPMDDWAVAVKAIEDRLVAGLVLLLISPLMFAIALLIKLDSPGPVFFRQKRYGYNSRLIDVLKFRTMHVHATDANAEQLTRRNDPRVTHIGAFLRRTSLDELPQFINVLRGDMSVVGPRPHALSAKAGGLLYPDAVHEYFARHRVKPGITGWAQVNGWRGETETVEQIRKRVEHDLYYIDNWSVFLDLRIILRTILCGFVGRNAY